MPYSVLNSKQKQFHGHKSYKTRESTLSWIGNFEENINLSRIHSAVLIYQTITWFEGLRHGLDMVQDGNHGDKGHRKAPGHSGVQGEFPPLGPSCQPQLCSSHFEGLAHIKCNNHHPKERRHVEKIHGHRQNFTR